MRGEPGIGKSRPIEETRQEAAMLGLACHIVWALDLGGATGRDPKGIHVLTCELPPVNGAGVVGASPIITNNIVEE